MSPVAVADAVARAAASGSKKAAAINHGSIAVLASPDAVGRELSTSSLTGTSPTSNREGRGKKKSLKKKVGEGVRAMFGSGKE